MAYLGLLLLPQGLVGQGFGGSYLSFDETLALPDANHIHIGKKAINVPLSQGNQISLIPPDMAQISPSYIKSVTTDTLPSAGGADSCISVCRLDTLFLSEDIFLRNVEIVVAYYLDGTYKGTSSFGRDLLNQMGRITQNGASISITDIAPGSITFKGRIARLGQVDPNNQPAFPFQQGDLNEIRLIKGNSQALTEQYQSELEAMLSQQPLICSFPSIDPNVPPQAALARLQNRITIRYFEPFHAQRAEALGEVIAFLLDLPLGDIFAEDMLSAYNGVPPVRDYLEVWMQ